MVWVQDNAVGLGCNKTEIFVFGYGVDGRSVCKQLQYAEQKVDSNEYMFSGAITQPGFCSDAVGDRLQQQSDDINTRVEKLCFGRGDVYHACLS